jgi:hypothetical protein
MKSPDVVLNELGQLYDFYKEIAKFKLKRTESPEKGGLGENRRDAVPQKQSSSLPKPGAGGSRGKGQPPTRRDNR